MYFATFRAQFGLIILERFRRKNDQSVLFFEF